MEFLKGWKRIYVILLGVLFVVTGIAFAQQGGEPPAPPSASDMVAKMKQELNLTDTQVNQITPVIQDEVNQMQALMGQGTDRDAVKTQMEALRQSTESKLSQYLTENQLAQWKNKQQPPQGQPPQGGGHMAPPRN